MRRRGILRRGATALAAATSVGLAGCSGGGGDTGPTGEVVENSVDGIEIAEHSGTTFDGELEGEITVENVGEQATDPTQYNYDIRLFEGEEDVTGDVFEIESDSKPGEVAPGESGTFEFEQDAEAMADVERYEITVNCQFADGVYCSG